MSAGRQSGCEHRPRVRSRSNAAIEATAWQRPGYGITKSGSNTLVLAASNTYSGTTTINSGILQLGTGTADGSVAGNIVNNAALVLEPGHDRNP